MLRKWLSQGEQKNQSKKGYFKNIAENYLRIKHIFNLDKT